ncbi:suppressor of tumorigenicity 14 protein homolog, partial [Megalobrama amblycephala]|uniref:suppressor of tumorigenicity 14 protein homolog n=1 Tax=Megalobrama amblycephala TaxID=75352 RepID=UPI0020147D1A
SSNFLLLNPDYPACTEKTCANGACYNNTQHCDGMLDCRDGSDESNCTRHCQSHQFECASGYCIPMPFVCDHWDDCGDSSDEQNCEYRTCSGSEFACSNGRCMPQQWVCDGINDCGDFSDENGCGEIDTFSLLSICNRFSHIYYIRFSKKHMIN